MGDPAGVRRDALGVPHLSADDVLELAHLQGRVTALDRGWQIEHHRWRTEGRTAEHVGRAGLPWDRFARQVRLEPTVRRCFEGLDPETREWLAAYVDGVNVALAEGLGQAPEIEALGLQPYAARPRPWEPWTPLGIFWGIHLLFGTFPGKLFNAHVAERLGPEFLPLFDAEGADGSGSNAWVVSGSRTAGGLPLVAGDPHRTIELPGCYQQVGLACPGIDVVGFTFPGVPGVQHFAHAGSVAWGITNAMADYQDLTLETLRVVDGPGGRRFEARGLQGWEPVEASTEAIAVRGAQPEVVPVVVTARGPVVTGLEGELERAQDGAAGGAEGGVADGHPPAYSLRTPTQVEHDLGFAALLPLLRARTVDDVEAALAHWVEPVNSALVADDTGAMRHLVVGRVPDRDEAGLALPLPAWDPRHAWRGYRTVPTEVVTDVAVSANDRASGGGLGLEYATPFRAERIRALVGDRTGLTADDCAAIHVDTRNGQAYLMGELVRSCTPEALGESARAVRDALLAWDAHSDAGSHGAALFAGWRTALVRWLAAHPVLAPIAGPSAHAPLFASWTDVPTQVGAGWQAMAVLGPRHGIAVGEGVRHALEHVAASTSPSQVWGERHWLDPVHALDGVSGVSGVAGARPAPRRRPVSGDKGCVLAAASAPGSTERCYGGPVARYVWDLADRSASRWVVPFGASGRAGEASFEDQTDAWLAGVLLPVDDPL